jgi:hypothetical protein
MRRRRTGISLRGVCVSVTVVVGGRRNRTLYLFGRDYRVCGEAVTNPELSQLHHCAKVGNDGK